MTDRFSRSVTSGIEVAQVSGLSRSISVARLHALTALFTGLYCEVLLTTLSASRFLQCHGHSGSCGCPRPERRAPAVMPDEYRWVQHRGDMAAVQGVLNQLLPRFVEAGALTEEDVTGNVAYANALRAPGFATRFLRQFTSAVPDLVRAARPTPAGAPPQRFIQPIVPPVAPRVGDQPGMCGQV